MTNPSETAGLTVAGCQARQHALREAMALHHLDAALLTDRRNVHYLTGYWCPAVFAAVVLIERDGPVSLVTPHPLAGEVAADRVQHYRAQSLATLVDDQLGAALSALLGRPSLPQRVGADGPLPFWVHAAATSWTDLGPDLLALRRRKHPDELALLRQAIAATEAAYAYAKAALKPGVSEVTLFAGMQAAAAEVAGEVLGEFGNDFQIGSPGGPPRRRPAQAGEIAVFDLSVTLRGYRSDMCRSFRVGGEPTREQADAHRRVLAALRHITDTVKPGVRCQHLYRDVSDMLYAGGQGWSFPHHLGHGIGLSAHETPRLNPHWDDAFEVGDVFTAEPGLYAPELRAGLRVEEIYHLTDRGLEQLTSFPTDLVAPG